MKGDSHLVSAGLLLGAGMGGFVDGIALHQLLQWHNMLSSIVPPTDLVSMKLNMLWDGVFHALTWVTTAAGIWRLWEAVRRPGAKRSAATLVAGMLMGWGLFNSVEGLIDHQLLGIHHVHPGADELSWDLAFIGSGLALCLVGWLLLRRSLRAGPTVS
jgi:uncharacterized membrane protein